MSSRSSSSTLDAFSATGEACWSGFFAGRDGEPFPHAVTTAHYWSVEGLSVLLERTGFRVIDSDARVQDGRRPHASISAVAV